MAWPAGPARAAHLARHSGRARRALRPLSAAGRATAGRLRAGRPDAAGQIVRSMLMTAKALRDDPRFEIKAGALLSILVVAVRGEGPQRPPARLTPRPRRRCSARRRRSTSRGAASRTTSPSPPGDSPSRAPMNRVRRRNHRKTPVPDRRHGAGVSCGTSGGPDAKCGNDLRDHGEVSCFQLALGVNAVTGLVVTREPVRQVLVQVRTRLRISALHNAGNVVRPPPASSKADIADHWPPFCT